MMAYIFSPTGKNRMLWCRTEEQDNNLRSSISCFRISVCILAYSVNIVDEVYTMTKIILLVS